MCKVINVEVVFQLVFVKAIVSGVVEKRVRQTVKISKLRRQLAQTTKARGRKTKITTPETL